MHSIAVSGRRTTIRLEDEMWESLKAIAQLEGCTISDLCTSINAQIKHSENLSSAIRVFVMKYYRDKATAEVPARAAEEWEKKVTINQKAVGDTDALDRLSLSMFPLSSARLKSSHLFKNAHLETMVELHNSEASGSMQIRPRDIGACPSNIQRA
jgi:predicted DNA-binding ribbon-helix-helix protein